MCICQEKFINVNFAMNIADRIKWIRKNHALKIINGKLKGEGEKIYTVKIQASMTQKEFAKRLRFSPAYICELEKGRRFPSGKFLMAVYENFKISPDWILFGEKIKKEPYKNIIEKILYLIESSKPALSDKEIDDIVLAITNYRLEKKSKEDWNKFLKKLNQKK